MLYTATFLFLHYRTRTLKRLHLSPSLLQHPSSPHLPTASRQRPRHKTHCFVTSLLSRRGRWFYRRNTKPPSFQEIFFFFPRRKKKTKTKQQTQRPYGHTVRCRNSLIGNHFVAHSENAGALVPPPQLVKPLRFHSTINKDLW